MNAGRFVACHSGVDILQTLKDEHRRFEAVIKELEAALGLHSADAGRLGLALYKDFLRHERFEDTSLFDEFRRELGEPAALRAMEAEHERLQVAAVALKAAFDPLVDRAKAGEAARRFADLLRLHMQREEEVLFPLAVETLGAKRLAELGESAEKSLPPRPTSPQENR